VSDGDRVVQVIGVQNDVIDHVRARRTLEHERDRAQTPLEEGAAPQDVVGGLRAAVVEHTSGEPADDLCLVVLRVRPRE